MFYIYQSKLDTVFGAVTPCTSEEAYVSVEEERERKREGEDGQKVVATHLIPTTFLISV
jgi:hypothetical protein